MFRHYFTRIMPFALAVSLLLTPIAPTYAQDAETADAAASNPAATETITETIGTINTDETPTTAAEAKTAVQATKKLIPNGEEIGVPEDKPSFAFLPLIANVTSGNAALEPDSNVEATATNAYWRMIRYLHFDWPQSDVRMFDCNGVAYGEQYWGTVYTRPLKGIGSAWPARGGRNGVNPSEYYYPKNACSWMIYGPFSLQYAQRASMVFYLWSQTELNYDFFGWYVSCDGYNFNGYRTSGDSGGWRQKVLILNQCLGDSTVWIGFRFTSDYSIQDDGPFVDDVDIDEYR